MIFDSQTDLFHCSFIINGNDVIMKCCNRRWHNNFQLYILVSTNYVLNYLTVTRDRPSSVHCLPAVDWQDCLPNRSSQICARLVSFRTKISLRRKLRRRIGKDCPKSMNNSQRGKSSRREGSVTIRNRRTAVTDVLGRKTIERNAVFGCTFSEYYVKKK